MKRIMISATILVMGLLAAISANAQAGIAKCDKQRLIVTTDLGGTDPDDIQSMMHLLVCADRMDIEGLISQQAWLDDPDKTKYIKTVIEHYAEVLPNLKKHSKGFPEADYLLSVTMRGQEYAHMDGVGEGKDSKGSEHIISVVDKKGDKRPVWIAAWGGMNTVAQALWKVKETRSEEELQEFLGKIRIYEVLGQDDAGAWIAKTFPDLFYIRNAHVYGWGPSDEWTDNNIQNRIPYGSHYPDRVWATEGDSPSFFYVYANGLNEPEYVDYGGWGGRFDTEKQRNIRGMSFIERSGKSEKKYDDYYMYGCSAEGNNSINIWKEDIWNNFAARMSWTTTGDFSAVNHHPTAAIGRDRSLKCIYRKVKSGKGITFDASKSNDPDNDRLSYRWYIYKEPGTYKGDVTIDGAEDSRCKIRIPSDAADKTIHFILEVSDNGTPSLVSYRRIVLDIQ